MFGKRVEAISITREVRKQEDAYVPILEEVLDFFDTEMEEAYVQYLSTQPISLEERQKAITRLQELRKSALSKELYTGVSSEPIFDQKDEKKIIGFNEKVEWGITYNTHGGSAVYHPDGLAGKIFSNLEIYYDPKLLEEIKRSFTRRAILLEIAKEEQYLKEASEHPEQAIVRYTHGEDRMLLREREHKLRLVTLEKLLRQFE